MVALDRDDRPVTNLRQDEVVILDGGIQRDVAFFRFDGASWTAETKLSALPTGLFTNRPEYVANAPRGVTAIVLDSVNSTPWDQSQARDQLLRYLETVPDGTRVGFYQLGSRRGVRLTYRGGYSLTGALRDELGWSEQRWQAAIMQPLGSTAVRLDARLDSIGNAHAIMLQMPAEDFRFERIDGTLKANLEIAIAENTRPGGFAYRKVPMTYTLEAPPTKDSILLLQDRWTRRSDTTSIRVIVRDRATGRYGTLDMPVSK